jgi:hypothetical protein
MIHGGAIKRVTRLALLPLLVLPLISSCGRGEPEHEQGQAGDLWQGRQQIPRQLDQDREGLQPPGEEMAHVVEVPPYTLRGSAVQSTFLPDEVAAQYGMEQTPETGVLTVVLMEQGADGQERSAPAHVTAHQDNLLGENEPIQMRRVDANGIISYIGSFYIGQRDHLRFYIHVQPHDSLEELTMEFEEFLGAPQG